MVWWTRTIITPLSSSHVQDVVIKECFLCQHTFSRLVSTHVCPFLPGLRALPKPYVTLTIPEHYDRIANALRNNTCHERITVCQTGKLAISGIWPFVFLQHGLNDSALQILKGISCCNPIQVISKLLRTQHSISYHVNIHIYDESTGRSYFLCPPWTVPKSEWFQCEVMDDGTCIIQAKFKSVSTVPIVISSISEFLLHIKQFPFAIVHFPQFST